MACICGRTCSGCSMSEAACGLKTEQYSQRCCSSCLHRCVCSAAVPQASSDAMTSVVADCLAKIERHGYTMAYVGVNPPYAYTVGLCASERHGYELMVSGLDPVTAHGMLARAVEALAGTAPEPGLLVERVLVGMAVRLRPVEDPGAYLGMVHRLYGDYGAAWQVEFPDDAGRFLGEDGCALPRGFVVAL